MGTHEGGLVATRAAGLVSTRSVTVLETLLAAPLLTSGAAPACASAGAPYYWSPPRVAHKKSTGMCERGQFCKEEDGKAGRGDKEGRGGTSHVHKTH